jgi:hypothetical protein
MQFLGGTMSLYHGGYVAAGVAMRNRGYGTITLSGIPQGAKIVSAYLFWDILANAEQPSFKQGKITSTTWFSRLPFNLVSVLSSALSGTRVSSGPDPCWGNVANFSYRAEVTSQITGNGSYYLSGFASGTTNGQDPWLVGSTAPMMEGASLVVIYSDQSSPATDITIYNGSFETQGKVGSQTISGFSVSSVKQARTTFIVADGQKDSKPGFSFNGTPISVPFSGQDHQDGTNYSQGNLWDTQTVDVGSLIAPNSSSATLTAQGGPDCIVWVAQVLAVSGNPITSNVESLALLAPVSSGISLSVIHGYNDPAYNRTNPSECDIASARDHCRNQQFGLDLVPGSGWDGYILAPAPGIPVDFVPGYGGDCLNFQLDNGVNLNICHFARDNEVTSLMGEHVDRGTKLGVASTLNGSWQPIHLSLDSRSSKLPIYDHSLPSPEEHYQTGGWTVPLTLANNVTILTDRTPYYAPIQFAGVYSIEGHSLVWDGHTSDQKFAPFTSTNVEVP